MLKQSSIMLFSALKGRGGPTVAPPGETTFARAARLRRKIQKSGKIALGEMDFLTDSRRRHQKILKNVGGVGFCVMSTFTKSRTEIRAI